MSSFCSRTVAEMEDINVVTSPPLDSPMNTTKFFNTSQVDGFTTPSPASKQEFKNEARLFSPQCEVIFTRTHGARARHLEKKELL